MNASDEKRAIIQVAATTLAGTLAAERRPVGGASTGESVDDIR